MDKQEIAQDLVHKIEQEVLSGALLLHSLGDNQDTEMDAARITRKYLVEILRLNCESVPTADEIRTYSLIYNRTLELLRER